VKGIPQGRYTREFRQEAVRLGVEERIACRKAALQLSLAPSTLTYWVKAYKAGKLGEIGKAQKPLTELEMELARTKKELAEVKMERDILKKRPRTLPGSRCPVRGNEADAAQLSHPHGKPDSEGLIQRLLRLAGQGSLQMGKGGNASRGRD